MRQENALTRILNEKIVCGGILWTRAGLYQDLLADGQSQRCADWFAFHGEPATDEQIANAINTEPNMYRLKRRQIND